MISTVELELSGLSPDLTWKTVNKGNRRGRRARTSVSASHVTKFASERLQAYKGLTRNNQKKAEELPVSEFEKVGVTILGRRFGDITDHVPIKKRKVPVIRSPSPPAHGHSEHNLHMEQFTENAPFRNLEMADIDRRNCQDEITTITDADFSGISILATAACDSDQLDEVEKSNHIHDFPQQLVELSCSEPIDDRFGSDKHSHISCRNSQLIIATLDQAEPFGATQNCSKSLNITSELIACGMHSTDDNSVAVGTCSGCVHQNGEFDSSILQDGRLHWDLNTVMDEWKSRCEKNLEPDHSEQVVENQIISVQDGNIDINLETEKSVADDTSEGLQKEEQKQPGLLLETNPTCFDKNNSACHVVPLGDGPSSNEKDNIGDPCVPGECAELHIDAKAGAEMEKFVPLSNERNGENTCKMLPNSESVTQVTEPTEGGACDECNDSCRGIFEEPAVHASLLDMSSEHVKMTNHKLAVSSDDKSENAPQVSSPNSHSIVCSQELTDCKALPIDDTFASEGEIISKKEVRASELSHMKIPVVSEDLDSLLSAEQTTEAVTSSPKSHLVGRFDHVVSQSNDISATGLFKFNHHHSDSIHNDVDCTHVMKTQEDCLPLDEDQYEDGEFRESAPCTWGEEQVDDYEIDEVDYGSDNREMDFVQTPSLVESDAVTAGAVGSVDHQPSLSALHDENALVSLSNNLVKRVNVLKADGKEHDARSDASQVSDTSKKMLSERRKIDVLEDAEDLSGNKCLERVFDCSSTSRTNFSGPIDSSNAWKISHNEFYDDLEARISERRSALTKEVSSSCIKEKLHRLDSLYAYRGKNGNGANFVHPRGKGRGGIGSNCAQWSSRRKNSPGYYNHEFVYASSQNTGTSSALKLENNGFVVASDGTIIRAKCVGDIDHVGRQPVNSHVVPKRELLGERDRRNNFSVMDLHATREISPRLSSRASRSRPRRYNDSRIIDEHPRDRFSYQDDIYSMCIPKEASLSPVPKRSFRSCYSHTKSRSRSKSCSPDAWASSSVRSCDFRSRSDMQRNSHTSTNVQLFSRIERVRLPPGQDSRSRSISRSVERVDGPRLYHHSNGPRDCIVDILDGRKCRTPSHAPQWNDNRGDNLHRFRESNHRRYPVSERTSSGRDVSHNQRLRMMGSHGRMKPDDASISPARYVEPLHSGKGPRHERFDDYRRKRSERYHMTRAARYRYLDREMKHLQYNIADDYDSSDLSEKFPRFADRRYSGVYNRNTDDYLRDEHRGG